MSKDLFHRPAQPVTSICTDGSARRYPRSIAEAWMRPPARQTTLQGPYTRGPRIRWARWAYAGLVLLSIASCAVVLA